MSDATVVALVTGLGTIVATVVGFLTLWVKLKYGVEFKIDTNTEMTRAGAKAATDHAKIAATSANAAAQKATATEDKITNMLNGQLDVRIRTVVKECFEPLEIAVQAHAEQDEKNMAEIRATLDQMKKGAKEPENG